MAKFRLTSSYSLPVSYVFEIEAKNKKEAEEIWQDSENLVSYLVDGPILDPYETCQEVDILDTIERIK